MYYVLVQISQRLEIVLDRHALLRRALVVVVCPNPSKINMSFWYFCAERIIVQRETNVQKLKLMQDCGLLFTTRVHTKWVRITMDEKLFGYKAR